MTIQRLSRAGSLLVLRFYPLLTWLFTALAIYNMIAIILGIFEGRRSFNSGTILALLIIVVFTIFLNVIAGDFTVCVFDRERRLVILRRYGLKGIYAVERPLNDLVSLKVQLMRGAYCQIFLHFHSGEYVPLTSSYVLLVRLRTVEDLAAALGVVLEVDRARK